MAVTDFCYYRCVLLVLWCTALTFTVCIENNQESFQLHAFSDENFWNLHRDERYSHSNFKIKDNSSNFSHTEYMDLSKCSYDCLRNCKTKSNRQKKCEYFRDFMQTEVWSSLRDAFNHDFMRTVDRKCGFAPIYLVNDSCRSCRKEYSSAEDWQKKFSSSEDQTKGEHIHLQKSDQLLTALHLSLKITFVATTASVCSVLVICSYIYLKSRNGKGINNATTQRNRNRQQRQRRRNRQRKNGNVETKQNGCTAATQTESKLFKTNDNREIEQKQVEEVLSTNKEASSGSHSASDSQQTDNLIPSLDDLCPSSTRVKQYNFSGLVKRSSPRENVETITFAEHSRSSMECERIVTKSIPNFDSLFEYDELFDGKNTEKRIVEEDIPTLNLLTDFEQEQTLSYLKLPDPAIPDVEQTVPKGCLNRQNETRIRSVSFTTGYPFNTDSTNPLTQEYSTKLSSRENGKLPDYAENEKEDSRHTVIKEYVENCSDTKCEEKHFEIDSHSEIIEIEPTTINLNIQLNQASIQEVTLEKDLDWNDQNEEMQKLAVTDSQNKVQDDEEFVKLISNCSPDEKAETHVQDWNEASSDNENHSSNPDSGIVSVEISHSTDNIITGSDQVSEVNYQTDRVNYQTDSCFCSEESDLDLILQTNEIEVNKVNTHCENEKRSEDCSKVEEINCSENKENSSYLNTSLCTSTQVGETVPFTSMEAAAEPVFKNSSGTQEKQSVLRKKKNKRKCNCQLKKHSSFCKRISLDCSETKTSNSQTDITVQVGETCPFISIDTISNLRQSYSVDDSDDLVTVDSSTEECTHQDNLADDSNSHKKNRGDIKYGKRNVKKNKFKSTLSMKHRERCCKGIEQTGNVNLSDEDPLALNLSDSKRKKNGKKQFCHICHKLNSQCKGHRTGDPHTQHRSFKHSCSLGFDSSIYGNHHSGKKDKQKLGTIEAVALPSHDSGFASKKSASSWLTKSATVSGQSPVKLLYKCLLKEVSLEKPSYDFHQQLKVLKHTIENEERRFLAKEICRELHVEDSGLEILGLHDYFDRISNGPPLTTPQRMQYEWLRLATFHNYTGNGNALALARNGFYHDHNNGPTSTRCFLCETSASNWEMFDDVSEEHRRRSPNCPLHGNRDDESLNRPITYENRNETPARSSAPTSVTTSAASSSVTSSSGILGVSRSLQGTSISQAHISDGGGESIPQQPSEDPESRDRSMLALPQTRNQRALGRTGHTYSTIIAPRRNNVATGAISNVGIDPSGNGSSTGSQVPGYRPSAIIGGPVGSGAFSGFGALALNTGSQTSVPRATEGLQGSSAQTSSSEGATGAPQTNPTPGAGGRTDPNITVVVDNPKHPDYLNLDSRIGSYEGWPTYLDQTPRQMSEAGFFYVGVADFTRCFCCGGGLRNWEPGDDPLLEHTRWFPRCEYVNKLKGERYVAAVQRRHLEHMAEQQRQQLELAQRRDENRNPPDPMTTDAAAVMREMGYSVEQTREAILAVRQQTGSGLVTTQQVLTWLLDDEERRQNGDSDLGVRPPPSVVSSTETTVVGTSIAPSVIFTGTSIASPLVFTGTSIGTSIVNTSSSISTATSVVSAGTTTSTVSSTSTSTTAEVQLSGTPASTTTEGSSSGTENQQTGSVAGSGSSSSSNSASGTSVEKQSGASGGDSDEAKSAAKEGATSTEPKSKAAKKKSAKKKTKNKPGTKSETAGATGEDLDAKSLKAENEKLREMQTCKICMERAVNTTLLPCGHLVCCDSCAARLQRCPICRKRIKGTVKTFMS